MWRELRETQGGWRWREAGGRRKGRPAGYNRRQEENYPRGGGSERLWTLWCQPASPPRLQWDVHYSPMLDGEAFHLEKWGAPWVLFQDGSWDEDKTVHKAQPHLSHTIILVFWFDLNFRRDQLISSLIETKEKDKWTPTNMGHASCWGLLLVKNRDISWSQ